MPWSTLVETPPLLQRAGFYARHGASKPDETLTSSRWPEWKTDRHGGTERREHRQATSPMSSAPRVSAHLSVEVQVSAHTHLAFFLKFQTLFFRSLLSLQKNCAENRAFPHTTPFPSSKLPPDTCLCAFLSLLKIVCLGNHPWQDTRASSSFKQQPCTPLHGHPRF